MGSSDLSPGGDGGEGRGVRGGGEVSVGAARGPPIPAGWVIGEAQGSLDQTCRQTAQWGV